MVHGKQVSPLIRGIQKGSKAFCGPEQLHIDLTNRCNLRCIACWHRSPLLKEKEVFLHWDTTYELPLDRVLALIDQVSEMGVKKIIYSGGGDPLLYKDIFRVLAHTASRKLDILLVSNLTMATRETMRRIVEAGITQLLVSLWAASPETYIRAHPGTSEAVFFKVVDLMKAFVELRRAPKDPELIIANVIGNFNYREVERMVRLAMDIGACDVWFQTLDVESSSLKELLLGREQIDELLMNLHSVKKKYESMLKDYQKHILCFDDFLEKLTNSRAPEGLYHTDVIDTMPCYIGWGGCRILANGDVVPCCKGDKHPLGNIFKTDFRKIWYSRRYSKFRKKAKLLSKSDPYFGKINCGKVCDNWCFNKILHERYQNYLKSIF